MEAALVMGASAYPISAIYLHLVAVMDYMSMNRKISKELSISPIVSLPDGVEFITLSPSMM